MCTETTDAKPPGHNYDVARRGAKFLSAQLSPLAPPILSPLPATRPTAEVTTVRVMVIKVDGANGAGAVRVTTTVCVAVVIVVAQVAAVVGLGVAAYLLCLLAFLAVFVLVFSPFLI